MMAKVTEKYLDEIAGMEKPTPGSKVLANLESQEQAASMLKDILKVAGQGASLGYGDEALAAIKTGSISSPEYLEERGKNRKSIAAAREEVPFSPLVEAAGQVASTAAVPVLRGAPILKEVISSGIQGAGEAEEMEDVPTQAAKSAGIQGATELLFKGAKGVLADNPTKILTRSMGSKTKDVMAPEGRGIQDSVERLNKVGFFKQGEVAVDPMSQKFSRVGKSLDTLFKPQSLDSLYSRATESISKLKDVNNSLIKGKVIPQEKLVQNLNDGVSEMTFDPEGFNVPAREALASEVKEIILNDLVAKGKFLPNKPIPAVAIEEAKKSLDLHMGSPAFKKRAEDLGINPEAMMMFRKRLDSLVDEVGGINYKKNNDMMSDLIKVKNVIESKQAKDYADIGTQLVDRRNWMDKLLETVSPTPVDIMRSDVASMAEKPMAQAAGKVLKATPSQALIKNREPQSVGMTPMEIAKARLPRTTEGLLQNKELVLSKLALNGVPEEMIDTIAQAMNEDPEALESVGALAAMQFPNLFARSKYNMFNGKILDPMQRAKAADDTSKRVDIDSIQRAKIINELNKNGKWLGE